MSQPADSVCITGVGMVASLGCSYDPICAAARAGIIRTSESEYRPAPPTTGEPPGAMVHAIPAITQGFEGSARTLRIIQGALTDLKMRDSSAPWSQFETRFFLSVADRSREFQGAVLASNEKLQGKMAAGAKEAAETPYDFQPIAELLRKAALLSSFGVAPKTDAISVAGHCGVAQCIESASRQLLQHEIQLAIVGAVDSLLDAETLAWLECIGRLKSAAMPTGLAPGEAGVFLVLETLQHAQTRNVRPLAMITGMHAALEEKTLLNGEPPTGIALGQLLQHCAKQAEWDQGRPCWVISDMNGESYRAMEWGNALVRTIPNCPALRQPQLWYPAISVGDTYAASGAVATALVMHAWTRRYAPARHAVMLQSSDGPERTAMVLSQAG